jgi:glycosidase
MGLIGLLVAVGGSAVGVTEPGATWAASLLPPRWWESAPAIARVGPRGKEGHGFALERTRAAAALDDLRKAGFTAIEVFAPAHGGKSFGGLDTIDRYRVDPALGTMDDFHGLIELAHARGMAVVAFDNLGYSSVEAVDFLKACDDVRAGRASKEASFYLWSDRANAPPPGHQAGNTFFMVRPTHLPGGKPGTFYDSTKHEFWAWSARAGKYYWSKWAGVDLAGQDVRLPQYDWGSAAFQEEAEKIVRFWMDTGIDGMIIDAVNWYVDHTWALGRRRMTDVIASYDNSYSQPEGAGGFREDPAAWITEGGWNSVQDYGLGIWWESGSDVIRNAIETGDPRPIERALRDYHDRVVAAGGTLYQYAPKFKDAPRQAFATAVVAAVGDLLGAHYPDDFPLTPETTRLLELKRQHPALQQLSTRRQIPTNADDKYHAFLRTAADRSERVLVMMNFQNAPASVTVDLSGVATAGLTNLRTSASVPPQARLSVDLPPYGYDLFAVTNER